jgi:phospholipid transport system transporter-binding protein
MLLVLPTELTHAQAAACLRMLAQAQAAQQDEQVVVDAGALARFDSSALAVLLACRRAALAQGKAFAVKAMPAALGRLAQLYGVRQLLADAA